VAGAMGVKFLVQGNGTATLILTKLISIAPTISFILLMLVLKVSGLQLV